MPLLHGKTNTAQPSRVADGTNQALRTNGFGEMCVLNARSGAYGLCLESSYFKACNASFDSAIAVNVAAANAFSETQGSITIRNSNSSGGKDIVLDYIRIIISAAGTGNTNFSYAIQADTTTRYSSGGSALTPVNCNSGGSNTTGAVIHAGALTLVTATATARKIGGGTTQIKASAPAANDVILFNFSLYDTVATTPGVATAFSCGPLILPAGATFVLHLFGTSQSAAPTGLFEIGYYER